ncbi:FMN-binding negative transcriptional regulator [Bordetella pseudohinzii]|uniref:Protease synthase and sporulation protein PAI 2 n=1 Tax=Bordetella pseudohinzii TaxID=1331258 RepID=A0A0J6C167_9BORD|nr:FMN-binding negative transcriptional regulator [Bordetella pseudohinzii]ANY17695.1 transcriptional regulator [Bordetella pseudohinzii]KMM24773.1 transcriptional regulator [Bordetella pseudohinzii]KXA76082.1 transcriptional regulator [Bordetella pseudohinzii]KXA79704.1 transcriptional regulator [Bordetella pseudohinzii]CUJ01710.1 Protease synthase and sporulation protein PAI 2 [Bordetella pseudohinzii]
MYIPAHFKIEDPAALHELMRAFPLGMLVTHGGSGLDVNHIPFELDEGAGALGVLNAHVARANPVWQDVADGDEALVVFRAEQAYISPSWYPSKHEAHKQVPTWNYRVVHARGRIVIRDDERYVRGVVARLTRRHEAGEPQPWKMSDSAPEYIDGMLRAIVGIQVEITALEGKFKLGQNKEARDIAGAGQALVERGEQALGQIMLACAREKSAG